MVDDITALVETLVETPDLTWRQVHDKFCEVAENNGEWAGVPLPVEEYELSIAPSFGYQGLHGYRLLPETEDENSTKRDELIETLTEVLSPIIINSWWCSDRGGNVYVIDTKGRRHAHVDRQYAAHTGQAMTRLLGNLGIAYTQDSNAEFRAMGKLSSLIKPHLFDMYVLQGAFLETSAKSGVTYVFRKGRPTLALRPGPDSNMRLLCALCMHPIGYYVGTHVGCMVPTDEVIAHLVMMRADEHYYWRKANQHPPQYWQAGIWS